ncbi:DUF885 domain-containing protein [Roseateles sp. NT4]|uniref:DUF885 domain-containing protein n=1 Tax=Roseateles sp. NT4 TaxID=3453715 RepID=UPI003EEE2767
MSEELALGAAVRLVSEAWDIFRDCAFVQMQQGGRLQQLPDLSEEAARAVSARAQAITAQIDAIDAWALPHAVGVPLRQARYAMEVRRHAGAWYPTVFDPSGVGFFGLFAPSAYCGGFALQFLFDGLSRQQFADRGDLDRYLAALHDLTACVERMAERTAAQEAAGMRIPKPQLPAARAIIAGFKGRLMTLVPDGGERFASLLSSHEASFRAAARQRVADTLEPAFDRWAAILDPAYEDKAPEGVGMSQYEGGAEIYRELVRLHTTLDLDPREIHETGLERLAQIQQRMTEIRSESGLANHKDYIELLRKDARFNASTPEAVGEVFQRYINRVNSAYPSAFSTPLGAGYGASRLPKSLESSMTFGYYSPARPGQPMGQYLFNGGHLTQVPLHTLAALTYHELVPGHHLHIASQYGNEALLPISRNAFCNAYNEGWAEYAANLAGELGLYATPEEQYGRCVLDAFLTCRLVVDTGMNALGWSLDRARQFMRENSFMSEAEICSETLRYSCDIPAQALAYKLGDTELMRARETARARLGDRFDLRDFHARVLAFGAMPLPDLHQYLNG